jgi:tRNA (cmo5U34)-methyltransferase
MEFVELFAGDRAATFEGAIRARIPGYEGALQVAAARLAAACPRGDVLSVGCGSGQDVIQFARRPAYRVTAIDPSPDMVALARERFGAEAIAGVDLRCCTVSELPDEPAYDAAMLTFVLHFIPDDGGKDRLLAAIGRRLRPGGALAILDFCRTETHAEDLSALRVFLDWSSRMAPAEAEAYVARVRDELHLLSTAEYAERARRAGFRSARQFHASLHVSGWLLEKAP